MPHFSTTGSAPDSRDEVEQRARDVRKPPPAPRPTWPFTVEDHQSDLPAADEPRPTSTAAKTALRQQQLTPITRGRKFVNR